MISSVTWGEIYNDARGERHRGKSLLVVVREKERKKGKKNRQCLYTTSHYSCLSVAKDPLAFFSPPFLFIRELRHHPSCRAHPLFPFASGAPNKKYGGTTINKEKTIVVVAGNNSIMIKSKKERKEGKQTKKKRQVFVYLLWRARLRVALDDFAGGSTRLVAQLLRDLKSDEGVPTDQFHFLLACRFFVKKKEKEKQE